MATVRGILKKSGQDRPTRDTDDVFSPDRNAASPSAFASAPLDYSVSLGTRGGSGTEPRPTVYDNQTASSTLVNRGGSKLLRGPVAQAKDSDISKAMPSAVPYARSSSPGRSSIDPLSQHIFMRTSDPSKPSRLRSISSRPESPIPDVRSSPPFDSPSKIPSFAPDVGKERKKSFLGRLSMLSNRRRDEVSDNGSESGEPRAEGSDAHVFSSIVRAGGFIPHYKEPPRYIRVKPHNKNTRDFDRMFLAQELIGTRPLDQNCDIKTPVVTISTANQVRKRAATGGAVWTTEFSKDGKFLAAGGRGHIIRIWAVISTQEDRRDQEEEEAKGGGVSERLSAPVFREKPVREFEGHTGDILDLSWSKNNFILSTAMDKTVRLWHISRQECLCTFKHKELVSKVVFHPTDDRFFLAGSLDSTLRLWSIPDKTIAFSTQLPDMITAAAFSPDGKIAIAGLLNGYCHFFETEGLRPQSHMLIRSSRGRNAKGSKITGIVTMNSKGTRDDDAKVLITSTDSRVRIYSLRDKSLEAKFKGHEHASSQLFSSFSDDGKYIICGSEDRKTFIWDVNTSDGSAKDKRPYEVFDAHTAMVTTAIFAPTQTRQLLGGSGDPIYDLCNPPPVTLMSVEEAMASHSGTSDQTAHRDDVPRSPAPSKPRPEETPAYIARSAHYDGNIIVTSDDTGIIKVFRQDCAASKRRHESWETGSSFNRKLATTSLVGRSGSIITRNSTSSAAHSRRGSLSQPAIVIGSGAQTAPAAGAHVQASGNSDHIISWRQGIEGNSRPISLSAAPPERSERSVSPTKAARSAFNAPGGLASEARKQPYIGANSPLSSHFPPAHIGDVRATAGSVRMVGRHPSATHGRQSSAKTTDCAQEPLPGAETADEPKGKASSERPRFSFGKSRDDKIDTGPTTPPEPSFSLKTVDDGNSDSSDVGGGYGFWNIHKWKGITGLRMSLPILSGSSSNGTSQNGNAGSHSEHHQHRRTNSMRSASDVATMPTSALYRSGSPDDDAAPPSVAAPVSSLQVPTTPEKLPRRRSSAAAGGVNGAHLTPLSATSTVAATDDNMLLPPMGDRGVYTRDGSVVSQLSSELTSSDGEGVSGDYSADDSGSSNDMRCAKCGSRDFKARRINGQPLLLCGRCGKVLDESIGSTHAMKRAMALR